MANLYYILKHKFNNPEETYFKFLNHSIKVITKDISLELKIKEIKYFKDNPFFIQRATIEYSSNFFFINYSVGKLEMTGIDTVYEDYMNILNKHDVNITMVSENTFMIEEYDIDIINEIYDEIHLRYNYTGIPGTHFFIKK